MLEKIVKALTNEKLSAKEISKRFGKTRSETNAIIRELRESGYSVKKERLGKQTFFYLKSPNDVDEYVIISPKSRNESQRKWVATGDFHFGCKQHDERGLRRLLEKGLKEGYGHCYISGDVVDGSNVYRGQLNNLSHWALEDQVAEAVRILGDYPYDYYAISGNHDYDWVKKGAPNPVKLIDKEIPRFKMIGETKGDVVLEGMLMRLIHGAGGCAYAKCLLPGEEILTERGWVKISEVSMNDIIATMNPETKIFEWEKPTSLVKNYFDGDLINFKSRCLDITVTPDHRMWVKRSKTNRRKFLLFPTKSHFKIDTSWKFKEAKDLEKEFYRQKWRMCSVTKGFSGNDLPCCIKIPFLETKKFGSGMKHIKSINSKIFIELASWFVTEGSSTEKSITIHQYEKINKQNCDEIEALIRSLNVGYYKTEKHITINSKELATYFRKEFGVGFSNKHLPKWMKELKVKYLKRIINIMVRGDGWEYKNCGFAFKSFSKQLLNDFSEICIKCGYGINMDNDTITIRKEQNYPHILNKPKKVPYNGFVYCVNVPNNLILVKNNNKIIWTGNSYPAQKYLRNLFASGKTTVDIAGNSYSMQIIQIGHFHTNMVFNEFGIQVIHPGAFQKPTEYTTRRGLEGPRGGYFVKATIKNGELLDFVTRWVGVQ